MDDNVCVTAMIFDRYGNDFIVTLTRLKSLRFLQGILITILSIQ